MTTGIYITQRELMALEGLSDLAFRTYFAIRLKMNIGTQISGQHARNSLNALALFVEQQIPRGLGVQLVRPTRRQVGIAIDSLIRNRLLTQHGEPGTMIYRLPLAYSAAESQAQKAARPAAVRPAHTSRGDVTAQLPASPASTRKFGNTSHNKTLEPVTYKAPGFIANKSIANPSDSPAISSNAANAFSWMKTASDGHRIAKPSSANIDALETLFRAGLEAVAIATQTALQRRRAENSSAPIQPRLVEKCLPKGAAPAPTQIRQATSQTTANRPETVRRQIDNDSLHRGLAEMQRIAARRLAKLEEARSS